MLGTFPKIKLLGDKDAAKKFYGLAMQQMEVLLNLMSFQDIKVDRRKLQIRGGGYIKLYVNYDYKYIEIFYPPIYKEGGKERKPWEPWNGSNGYFCVDHLWEFNMITGLYSDPKDFHSTVTDYYGADPQPDIGYPGIAAETNPSLCNLDYTWTAEDSGVEYLYWPVIAGGKLTCTVYSEPAGRGWGYYSFHVVWDNRGTPGDPINPTTNKNAAICEVAAICYADADEGLGFGEAALANAGSAIFWLTDGVAGPPVGDPYTRWYVFGIDENLYNDTGYIPTIYRPYFQFVGDLGFDTGHSGAPIYIDLAEAGFTGDIVRCGWSFDTSLKKKGSPGGGRNIMLINDYIDFY